MIIVLRENEVIPYVLPNRPPRLAIISSESTPFHISPSPRLRDKIE
jgi:hypothetical protein